MVDAAATLKRIRPQSHSSAMQTGGVVSIQVQTDHLAARSRQVKFATKEDLAVAKLQHKVMEAQIIKKWCLEVGPQVHNIGLYGACVILCCHRQNTLAVHLMNGHCAFSLSLLHLTV